MRKLTNNWKEALEERMTYTVKVQNFKPNTDREIQICTAQKMVIHQNQTNSNL